MLYLLMDKLWPVFIFMISPAPAQYLDLMPVLADSSFSVLQTIARELMAADTRNE